MRTFAALLWRDDDTRAARPAAARGTRWLAVWAVLAASAGANGALAQGSVPCTAIDDDTERLACYDRALRSGAAAPAPTAAPAPSAAADPALSTSDRRSERRMRESTATTAPAAPVAPAAAAAPAGGIFASGDEVVPIVIVNVRALPGREARFTDGDGTYWVQTDSQRIFNLPEAPFDAELKRGAMGSYFLVPEGKGRAIRVRQAR